MKPCIHPDCIYSAAPDDFNGCNYALITGKTRLAQLPKKFRSPHLCTLYVPGERVYLRDNLHLLCTKNSKLDKQLAWELYRKGLPEEEVSALLGCSVKTARALKKRKEIYDNDR